jgi:CheY-like chemotaxis protein
VLARQSGNLRRLVDDLLDVARVTQGKIEPQWEVLDVVALLDRVAQNARRTRADRRGQRLEFRATAEPLMVRGDPLRLEQVFVNLIDNATKYTPEGGRIEVEVGGQEGVMRASVRDNGAGIPQSSLDKVFDLFMQADVPLARAGGGLGVGLTLVHALVGLHGGEVTIHSDGPGRGTEVVVTLPLAAPVEQAHVATAPPLATSPGRRVLIVEDNLDARESLRLLLEMWGHEVHVEGDGVAGVDAILTRHPDVALVDIGLPLLDGHQVAQRVSTAGLQRRPLLVALSGYGDTEQREAALRAGFDLHLVKPVDPDQLDALVRNATRVAT